MKTPSSSARNGLAAICLALLLCALAAPLPGQNFRSARRLVTGQDPSSINVADLNGDGHPDLLYSLPDVPNSTVFTTGTIHTLLGQPGGGYVAGPVLPLPADTNTQCRTGDLNGDSLVDLLCPSVKYNAATASYVTAVVFFPGRGDGSFGAPVYSQVKQPGPFFNSLTYPLLSTFADANHDGRMDVLVVDPNGQLSYVLLGKGDGTFTYGGSGGTGNGVGQLLDLNGDGIPDLVQTNGPFVQLGKGDGSFGNTNLFTTSMTGCAYGDVDGDGHADALCAYAPATGSGLYVLHGRGNGLFDPVPVSSTLYPGGTSGVAGYAVLSNVVEVRDINGDGIPDVLGYGGNGWTMILGRSGLAFDAPRPMAAGYLPGAEVFSALYPPYAFADLDGDGKQDLVAAGPLGVYITSAQSPLAQQPPEPVVVAESGYKVGNAAVADFNGDGIPDVAASGSKDLTLSTGKGDGTFNPPVALVDAKLDFSTARTAPDIGLLAGDFDGDGKQDLLTITSTQFGARTTYLLQGHGDGTFSPAVATSLPLSSLSIAASRPVFDINGDGRDDLMYVAPDTLTGKSTIYFALSNGDGTFRTVSTPPANATAGALPVLGDFNGDGRQDAVNSDTSNAYVLTGNGDGTFRTDNAQRLPLPTLPGYTILSGVTVTTGDFDGDGHLDFAVLASQAKDPRFPQAVQSTVSVFYGAGDGSFTAAVQTPLSRNFSDLLGVDLDQDGRSDLVLHNSALLDFRAVGILPGRADRTLGAESGYYAGGGISTMAAVDLNRDGLPDLLFANGDLNVVSTTVTALINLGDGGVHGLLVAAPEPSALGDPFDVIATLTPPAAQSLAGAVALQIDGQSIGSATLAGNTARMTAPATLAAGVHRLSATWPGDATHRALTLAGTHTIVGPQVILLPTNLVLIPIRNPAYKGETVAITATTTYPGLPQKGPLVRSGKVRFFDGSTLLGEVTLSNNVAILSIATLSVGSHPLTAVYTGDAVYAGATSAPVTEIIQDSGLLLTAAPTTLSLATQHHVTFTLTATSVGGFTDTVYFSVTGLPQHATLQFRPGSAHLSPGQSAGVTVYLDTSDVIGYLSRADTEDTRGPRAAALAGLAVLPLGLLLARRRRRFAGGLLLLAIALLCGFAGGCSGKYPNSVVPGNYTLHLVATGGDTGVTQALDLPVTVTP